MLNSVSMGLFAQIIHRETLVQIMCPKKSTILVPCHCLPDRSQTGIRKIPSVDQWNLGTGHWTELFEISVS